MKCAQYWPELEDESEKHGDISVTLLETVSYGDFIKRRLKISRDDEV